MTEKNERATNRTPLFRECNWLNFFRGARSWVKLFRAIAFRGAVFFARSDI